MKFFAGVLSAIAIMVSFVDVILFAILFHLSVNIYFPAGIILGLAVAFFISKLVEVGDLYDIPPCFSFSEAEILEKKNEEITCNNARTFFLVSFEIGIILSYLIFLMK